MKKAWWHDKVAYQIYPKSFLDTNGDGIGDLRGIISKLDYLKELGVDIVWISPIYCSPLADQGYDISDYYKIDPRFGTMEEMEELIAEAGKRDMYILVDLVVNHCSDEHEWFQKACEDPDGTYGKYFYIVDAPEDGSLPTNWRAYFGGSVWDKLPGHPDKYYLHSFHKKQPDLNWENPKLREEIYQMVNWWLDKGLGGFRLDAIINIKKALPMQDYEPDREDGLCAIQKMLADARGIGVFLKELQERCFKPHNAFTVGEVFDVKEKEILDFVGDDGYFSTMFNFSTTILGNSIKGWYDRKAVTPSEYKTAVFHSLGQVKDHGFLANIIENHDEPRGVSHYISEKPCSEKAKKLLAMTTVMAKGLPFFYQGQEIGMENMPFDSIEEVDDINTLDEYQVALRAGLSEKQALEEVLKYSRDNSRTPMQWNGKKQAGFTSGMPWLKVNPNYIRINVEDQQKDEDSVFHFYQKLIQLRKHSEYRETIVYGTFEPMESCADEVMAFTRRGEEKELVVLANFSEKEQEILLEKAPVKMVLSNDRIQADGNRIVLKGYDTVLFEI